MSAIDAKTLGDLGWAQLVEHWATRAATVRGARAIRGVAFYQEPAAARRRVAEIAEARRLTGEGAGLPLGGIEDVATAIDRVVKAASLDAPELIAVAGSGAGLGRLRKHLRERSDSVPALAAIAAAIADLGHVYHPILEAFDPSGQLVDHASEDLGRLRRALAAIKGELERRVEGLVHDERYASWLQDSYFTERDERYVLPIRNDGKGFVEGIVHGTSQSGQTIFIEPAEIVDLNNKKRLAECDVADEERRIFIKFSGWIAEEAPAFLAALGAAETLDVIAAAARLADDLIATAPIIDDAPRVGLLFARHPLMLLAGRRCVANDVTLAAQATLVVSGPNAGGKTVVLKTTGLCALMARAGLHLPAESGSAIGWFRDVRTDIGDTQSIEHSLSTFTGHISALREFIASAAPGSLLLIDEIAVGTDPEQGAALAQAVLEALAARGATCVVTSHYARLKALADADPRFVNASVGFDAQKLEPTFKLHLGTPGSSGAFTVAEKTGLPREVVGRARELLGPAAAKVVDLLASVTEQRRRLEEERAAVIEELEAAEAERVAFRAARDKSMRRYEKQQERAHGEALAALKAARRELDAVRADLRAKSAEIEQAELHKARRTIAAAGSEIAKHQPAHDLPPGRQASEADLVPGAPVLVPSVGGRGVVASAPKDGKVEVRLGAMHTQVAISEVWVDSHRAARKQAHKPAPGPVPAPESPSAAPPPGDKAGARTPDTTLDVRGQRADEATAAVDRFLDESALASRDVIFIVHGHGTGALRAAVRAHLVRHPAVAKHRGGEAGEGGDGATVVWLK